MSREDFVAMASRLFSIFLLLTIARHVPSAVALFSGDMDATFAALVIAVLVGGLVVCAFLWFFPLTVARKLLPVMKEPRSETSMDASIALSVGLTLIGVWLMARAIVDAVYWIALYLRTQPVDAAYYAWGHEQVASVAATVVEFALAIWLIFGVLGIKRLIYRYRYGKSGD